MPGPIAYVEKPFSMEHIFAQISNLLTNRNKIKEAFGKLTVNKSEEYCSHQG